MQNMKDFPHIVLIVAQVVVLRLVVIYLYIHILCIYIYFMYIYLIFIHVCDESKLEAVCCRRLCLAAVKF